MEVLGEFGLLRSVMECIYEISTCRGATGYGHFDIENFTDMRMIVVHAAGRTPYPVVG